MTDIYTPEGVLDYAEAARTLANVKGVTNDTMKAQTVARVEAAALLDIAVSLNRLTLLAEGAEFPLGSDAHDDDEREVGPDGQPLGEPERGDDDPLEVGDWVAPREVAGPEDVEPVQVLGTDVREGELVLDLGNGWMFASAFYRVKHDPEGYDLDTPDDDDETDDEAPDPRDAVDDIDDDFSPAPEPVVPAERCGAAYTGTERGVGAALVVACARKAGHDGKHRKGNLKWV